MNKTDMSIDVSRSIIMDESVKENRKVMSLFLKKIQEGKTKSYSYKHVYKECNDIINSYIKKRDRDLFTLEDEDKNTCKLI